MQDILIKNGKVLVFDNDDVTIVNKDILVKNGKIEKIENKIDENLYQNVHLINAENNIVMPGLINTHSHIAMSIFRVSTEDVSLYKWLHEIIWPAEDKLTKEDIYNASMLSFIEAISTGTTCINDQYFMPEQTRKAATELKIRAVLTRPLMDLDGDIEERIEEFKNFYQTRDKENDLITYTVSPHGLYTCSGECLKKSAELAKEYNLPVHVHFLESIDEIEDIKKLHGMSGVEVLKKYFSDVHLILAHGVKLSDEDINVLKQMDLRNCT